LTVAGFALCCRFWRSTCHDRVTVFWGCLNSAGLGLLCAHHSGLSGGRGCPGFGGRGLGFQPGCETIRSASCSVIPSGKAHRRTSVPSVPSCHSPMRGSMQPVSKSRIRVSLSRLANRRSSKALAAARDWLEPNAKSPGFKGSIDISQMCQPPGPGRYISAPGIVSHSSRAEPASLRLAWLSYSPRAPVQQPATGVSLEDTVRVLHPCHSFPSHPDALR
jgi:hypothetical protein